MIGRTTIGQRTEEDSSAVDATGRAGPALPSDVVADEISDWIDSDGYFKAVAHSGRRADRDEFVRKLFAVEDILLQRMQPRPVSDLDEIDQLLAEGENAD